MSPGSRPIASSAQEASRKERKLGEDEAGRNDSPSAEATLGLLEVVYDFTKRFESLKAARGKETLSEEDVDDFVRSLAAEARKELRPYMQQGKSKGEGDDKEC